MGSFSKEKVLFSGYYGQLNTGDDTFCAVAAWGAQHYWRAGETLFLCRELPVLPVPAKPALSGRRRFRGQGLLQTVAVLAKKPTIIFAGGSIFHSTGSFLGSRSLISMCQMICPSSLGAIGVSVGPFTSSKARKQIEGLLSRFSFLALRDRRSYEVVCAMNLPYEPVEAFDLAGLLPVLYGPARCSENKDSNEECILGVSICHYERYVGGDFSNEQRREEQIAETLKIISKTMPVTIRFLVFNGNKKNGDQELTDKIAGTLADYAKTEIVPYSQDPSTMWHKIGECRAVLATRLHAGIFSCIADVPFLLVEYHQKCIDFLEDINCPAQWRIGDMEVSSDRIAKMLERILTDTKQSFPIEVDSLIRKAKLNFTGVCD